MSILRESESIVHHTNKIPLVKILKAERFKVSYCSERIYVDGVNSLHIAVPMVSFSDIKLSDYVRTYRDSKKIDETAFALGYYGDYAISLSKKWAREKYIYPICYISRPKNQREVADNYVLKDMVPFAKIRLLETDKGTDVNGDFPKIASFCKHNIGYLEKENPITHVKRHEYAFYNEHEYRYVPSDIPLKWNFYNNESDYSDGVILKNCTNKSLSSFLSFDIFEDVTAIVVQTDNDINDIVDILNKKKEKKLLLLTEEEQILLKSRYQILLTKIITTHQLLTEV